MNGSGFFFLTLISSIFKEKTRNEAIILSFAQIEYLQKSEYFSSESHSSFTILFSKNLTEIIAKRVNRYWVIPPIFLENFSGRIRTGMEGRLDWKSRKILIVLRSLSLDILPALKDGNSQMAIAP